MPVGLPAPVTTAIAAVCGFVLALATSRNVIVGGIYQSSAGGTLVFASGAAGSSATSPSPATPPESGSPTEPARS